MDITAQLDGLDRFLRTIYGDATLESLLDELGFDGEQERWLCEERKPQLAAALVEALRQRLASGEKDLWFRLLCRRYGLDGEPALSLDEAARALAIDPGYASQAQEAALAKCRTKTLQEKLRGDLRQSALAELKQAHKAPDPEEISGKLRRLADLHAAVDLTRMDYEAKRNEVLKKVQAELDALASEYEPLLDAAQENAAGLEGEIKNDVLLHGQSVTTELYQAVYMKGRVAWDNEGINRYAEAHPEVLKFRRVGAPAVSLRAVGKE
jgi:hypothetical protein